MSVDPDFDRYYRLLEVTPEEGWKAVQIAYRKKAQAYHPDRAGGHERIEKIAKLRFEEVTEAYEQLKRYRRIFGDLPPTGLTVSGRAGSDRPKRPNSTAPDAGSTETDFGVSNAAKFENEVSQSSPWLTRSMTAVVAIIIGAVWFSKSDPGDAPSLPAETRSGESSAKDTGAADAGVMFVGMPIGQLIDGWGRPDRTIGDVWYYGDVTITLAHGKVLRWNDPNGRIDAAGSGAASASVPNERFDVGFTAEDVRRIQGEPVSATESEWDYGVSKVYFENGRVTGWFNSPIDPLKVARSRDDADH
ncbi:MAG: J domain-containing protein [Xanthomonadales bacterium]|nr:J domain-containing protein [Xanthomonadales bacterium]